MRAAATPLRLPADVPTPWHVSEVRQETPDVVTLFVEPLAGTALRFRPGQFSMIGVPGVGEAPISISTPATDPCHGYTIRRAGAVTSRLVDSAPGDIVTIRGPLGHPWDLGIAAGGRLLVIGGGIGIAPLRSAIYEAATHRDRFASVDVVVGATRRDTLVYGQWLASLDKFGIRSHLTVEDAEGAAYWKCRRGRVTDVLPDAIEAPETTHSLVCGPDAMIGGVFRGLTALDVPRTQIQVTLERNMHCGTGTCGHCQLGGLLICRDGPVLSADRLGDLLDVEEL